MGGRNNRKSRNIYMRKQRMSPNEVEGVEGMGSTGKVGSVQEGLLYLRGWKEDSG